MLVSESTALDTVLLNGIISQTGLFIPLLMNILVYSNFSDYKKDAINFHIQVFV
jgi:hypothetical protein